MFGLARSLKENEEVLTRRTGPNLWIIRNARLRERIDLQYRSIVLDLRAEIPRWPRQGRVLDFGSGTNPYREWIPSAWTHRTLDPAEPGADFRSIADLEGQEPFDRILLIEVLEHLPEPDVTLGELSRHLTPQGEFFVTIPFAARIHPCPRDFRRWTPDGLARLFESAGLEILELRFRGSDLATIVSKTLYYFARRAGFNVATLAGLALAPLLGALILICGREKSLFPADSEDPLGFTLRARRKSDAAP